MEIDQLVAFEQIVREGSFSRAAWALQIGQPAISARIHALEHELGGPLFTRSGRRVALTALGASLLPFVRRGLAMLAEGMEVARLAHLGQRGRVAVGVLGSLAGSFLAPALAEFYRAHPQVECLVRAGDHEQVVELLCDGLVDLGLIAWPCVAPPGVDLVPLVHIREPVALVAPPAHPLAQRGVITQADVSREGAPLLLPRWWPTQQRAVTRIAALVGSVVEVPIETARHLLLAGLGVAFFTRTQIAADLAAGHIVELSVSDLPPLFRDSALVRLERPSPLSAATANFVDVVREQAARMRLLAPHRPGS